MTIIVSVTLTLHKNCTQVENCVSVCFTHKMTPFPLPDKHLIQSSDNDNDFLLLPVKIIHFILNIIICTVLLYYRTVLLLYSTVNSGHEVLENQMR